MKNIYLTIILFTVSFYTYAQTAEEYYANGSLKMELENYDASIEDFTKSIALNPHNPEAYYLRAYSKNKLGDYIGVIEDHSKVIELDTENSASYYYRGFAKYNKDAETQRNLQTHHIARLYMMKMEERGRIISYEQALEETDY